MARTERPTLPTRSAELTTTEHLQPIGHPETGVFVQVDKGWLDTMLTRFAEAIAAVTRANARAGANKLQDACARAIFETGVAPATCSER